MSRGGLALLWCGAVVALAAPVAFVAVAVTGEPARPPVTDPPVAGPSVAGAPSVPLAATPDYGPWAARIAAATGIPEPAVLAYAHTEVRLAAELPECGLSWATLAGIGAVESDHGRFQDRVLGPDGRPDRPIVGVALDGSPGVAAIRDTDGGVHDGDVVWDRAVGPLQFIPGTWRRRGADGDGDGAADPQDVDDAALAAGRYLCEAGDLSTGEGWRSAVLSYNASESYVRAVLTATNGYAAASREA